MYQETKCLSNVLVVASFPWFIPGPPNFPWCLHHANDSPLLPSAAAEKEEEEERRSEMRRAFLQRGFHQNEGEGVKSRLCNLLDIYRALRKKQAFLRELDKDFHPSFKAGEEGEPKIFWIMQTSAARSIFGVAAIKISLSFISCFSSPPSQLWKKRWKKGNSEGGRALSSSLHEKYKTPSMFSSHKVLAAKGKRKNIHQIKLTE